MTGSAAETRRVTEVHAAMNQPVVSYMHKRPCQMHSLH